MQRFGTPGDVAAVIAFLLSDEAFIIGQALQWGRQLAGLHFDESQGTWGREVQTASVDANTD